MDLPRTLTLAGKIALITGASSGIGRATARRLGAAGAHVLATGRDRTRLDTLVQELGNRAEALTADLAKTDEIARMMQEIARRYQHIDILVINAGVANAPSIDELDLHAYDGLMDVNVKGAVFTFVQAIPLLAESASVVFVGSVAGSKGQPGDPLYAGGKGFIRTFARNVGT
jgi:NADP-dependent 3-hydroxy acid dehydrogenase YdfG